MAFNAIKRKETNIMLKEKVTEKVIESIVSRFLKNSGLDDIIENPKKYEMTFKFNDDGFTLNVKKDED